MAPAPAAVEAPAPAAPPDEPVWIPPARPRKKKAALTPKEALRAKVQARALKQASKHAPAAEQAEGDEHAGEGDADEAKLAVPEVSAPAARPKGKARAGARPAPVVEDDEPAPPPVKPSFFQRLLCVFRRPKRSAGE